MRKVLRAPIPASGRRPARATSALFRLAAALVCTAPPLSAQFGPPPKPVTVIDGGTVHLGNGDVLEKARIVVRGSRIEAVGGQELAIPDGATLVDATGKHVHPGLVDVESSLLLDTSGAFGGEGNLTATVVDALDPYSTDELEAALRGGVTTIGVPTRRALFDGTSAAIKLRPRTPLSELVLREDVAATLTFGLTGDRPSMRLREWKAIADQFQATVKYVEQWDEYAEKLEEYKKELEKAKKEADQKKPGDAPAPEKKETPSEPPKTEPAPERPQDGGGGRRPWPRRRPGGNWAELLEEVEQAENREAIARAEGPPAGPQGAAPAEGEKKDEGPKKPPRPVRDPQREVMRRVLDGKLPLNVYADRASDVANLLELSSKHAFRFVVTGGREVGRIAKELANAGVAVVVVQPHDLSDEHLATAAELDAAGVTVVLTTAGRSGIASRHLTLSAAAAVAGGMEPERALAAITSRAAELLGVGDRVGTIAAGKDADLVITSGDPLSSTSVVERVMVGGETVFAR